MGHIYWYENKLTKKHYTMATLDQAVRHATCKVV